MLNKKEKQKAEMKQRLSGNTLLYSPVKLSTPSAAVFEVSFPEETFNDKLDLKHVIEDARSVLFLLYLYTIQGIPVGLSASIPFLLQGHVHYDQLGIYSLVSLPFSLKVFWAPLVDSLSFPGIGRRKSWLVPIQLLCSLLMYWGSTSQGVDHWLGSAGMQHQGQESLKPNLFLLTLYFATLYFIMATQDIVVDGWALTLLTEKNRPLGSICNVIGQTFGFSVAHFGFLALQDPRTCNRFFRRVSSDQPLVTYGYRFWSICVFISTILSLFYPEAHATSIKTANSDVNENQKKHEDHLNIKSTYIHLMRIIQMKPVLQLGFILLTCRFAFGSIDGAASLKLIEAGIRKEELALLGPFLVPISLLSPLLISRLVCGPTPLKWFEYGWICRSVMSLVWIGVVYVTSILYSNRATDEGISIYFFAFLCIVSALQCCASDIMFSSQMGFFARVSDPTIGGCYMTLLNTIANIGQKWPATVSLLTIEKFRIRFIDGFYVQTIVFSIMGFAWLKFFMPTMSYLQLTDRKQWLIKKSPI